MTLYESEVLKYAIARVFEYSAGRWEVWQIEQISCNYNTYSLMQFVLHASGVDLFECLLSIFSYLRLADLIIHAGPQRRGGAPLVLAIILHFTEACKTARWKCERRPWWQSAGDGLLRADYACARAGAQREPD